MIGERLQEVRKDYHDTQAMLAEKLNVSVPTIRSWEQEKSSPSHELLVDICRLYDVSSDFLLGLSNIYPTYKPKKLPTGFTEAEMKEIKDFERYILSKRKK